MARKVTTKKVGGVNVKTAKGTQSPEQKAAARKARKENKLNRAARHAAYLANKKKPGFKKKQFMSRVISKLTHGKFRKKMVSEKTGKLIIKKYAKMKPEAAAPIALQMWKEHTAKQAGIRLKKARAKKDTPKANAAAPAAPAANKPKRESKIPAPASAAPNAKEPKVKAAKRINVHTEKLKAFKEKLNTAIEKGKATLTDFSKKAKKATDKRLTKDVQAEKEKYKQKIAAEKAKHNEKLVKMVEGSSKKLNKVIKRKEAIVKKGIVRVKKTKPVREKAAPAAAPAPAAPAPADKPKRAYNRKPKPAPAAPAANKKQRPSMADRLGR